MDFSAAATMASLVAGQATMAIVLCGDQVLSSIE
jgi:hypothetical protein